MWDNDANPRGLYDSRHFSSPTRFVYFEPMRLDRFLLIGVLAAAAAACSKKSSHCNPGDPDACGGGKVCEWVVGGAPACVAPVVVKGQVTNLATGAVVSGARVVALDANRAPASVVATTDVNGNYSIRVPSPRTGDGAPTTAVTLRADARDYQSFPGGVRPSLPIDLAAGTLSGDQWVVQSALTNVGLIHLPDTTNLLSISGTVALPPSRVGVLVVAEPTAGGRGHTAIADTDGSYTIFNLPASASPGADYTVSAYGEGVNYAPGTATLIAGGSDATVNLAIANTATATIASGLIFNSGAGTPTSVALVVASTYDAALDRGESPPGLVAHVPSGSTYAIAGVPDGTYIALAAFEIDGDVRDVSGVGNTAPVQVVVQSGALVGSLGQFKLVGAIDLQSIDGVAVGNSGAPIQLTSATPTFMWVKAPSYSSADTYETEVLDAFGTTVFTQSQSGSGGNTFSATYAGTPLTTRMYYQLRIKAVATGTNVLSQTEDLQGVFYMP